VHDVDASVRGRHLVEDLARAVRRVVVDEQDIRDGQGR
jgi:hypothetical protein